MTVVLTANDTCEILFDAHPEAVYAEVYEGGREEWMIVEVRGTGDPAYFMIVRDTAEPGRYAISVWPEGYLGDIEAGTEPPGEIADVITGGIPLARGC